MSLLKKLRVTAYKAEEAKLVNVIGQTDSPASVTAVLNNKESDTFLSFSQSIQEEIRYLVEGKLLRG